MKRPTWKVYSVTACSAAVLIALVATTAPGQTVDSCDSRKTKCVGRIVERMLRCHAAAERRNRAVDPACLARATDAFSNIDETGCWDRFETRDDCVTTADAGMIAANVDAFVLDVVTALDPGYPAPTLNRCSAAKKRCVSDQAVGLLGCYAKAGDRAACILKTKQRFDGDFRVPPAPARGCFAKLEARGGCLTVGDTAALEAEIDAFVDAIVCALDPTETRCRPTPTPAATPTRAPTPSPTATTIVHCHCGDGLNGSCEACDPTAPSSGWFACGPDFTCTSSCTCACPTRLTLSTDASDPATVVDLGATGIAHREPEIGDSTLTLGISCTESTRPCGLCAVSGPVANPFAGAGQLDNRRCTNDTRITCNSHAPCTGGGGTCEFFLGANWPVSVGGIGMCVTRQLGSFIEGTANVETGAVAATALQVWNVYLGPTSADACPRCVGDGTANDGVPGGTCSEGAHAGVACDANGSVGGLPDFGATSLDCPPLPTSIVATLPLVVDSSTATVTETLTASSPRCSGAPSKQCLCDTCNNADAQACQTNADCPDPAGPILPICGGRRCIAGANEGAACIQNSQCPGGACARAGAPTRPNGCADDTATALDGTLCVDTAPFGDDEGECPEGPLEQSCVNHPQRACVTDADCDGVPEACRDSRRRCFLDNGIIGNAIVAAGMADTPMADRFLPTRASVFCVPPTDSPAVDTTFGFPGAGRMVARGDAVFLP